jgi:hypothetical protein
MARRKLSPDERRKIGQAAAAKASHTSGRIVRVLVAPQTDMAGNPVVAQTSAPNKTPPSGEGD